VSEQLVEFIPEISGVTTSLSTSADQLSLTYTIMFNGPNHKNGDISLSPIVVSTGGLSNVGAGLSGVCASLITDEADPTNTVVTGSGVSTVVTEGVGNGQTYTIDPPFEGFDASNVNIYRMPELFTIANTGTFDSSTIPLAKVSHDKDQQGVVLDTFVGPFSNQFRLYKVDGHVYTVHFDTNLGNLAPLTTGYDELVGTDAVVYATDDVVQGELPTSYSVTHLKQGVPYHFRVKVKTHIGWSVFSSPNAVQGKLILHGIYLCCPLLFFTIVIVVH